MWLLKQGLLAGSTTVGITVIITKAIAITIAICSS